MNRFLTIVRMSGKPVKPKLKLGGLVKMGTAANIKEHGGNVPAAAAPAADAARLEAAAPPKAAVAPKPPAASAAPKPPAAAPAPKPPAAAPAPKPPAAAPAPKPAAAAPAPKPAAAAPAASAAPPPPPQQKNLSKYDDQLQDYAIEILGEESNNPYKNKTERPIFPLQTRLGFQSQILKVYNSFAKIPDLAAPPDFDACKKLGAGAQQQVETY
jgi:outer membrane biosynthesis protein TonB